MRSDPPRFRSRRLALTSLVDVIFLLLLFFMLTTSFARLDAIELGAAAAGGGGDLPDHLLRVGAGSLSLNGRAVGRGDLPDRIAQGAAVLVTLREEATAQHLVDALVALRAVGGLRVAVVN